MPRTVKSSEVDAYVFIKENLKLMGWDIRNPLRCSSGQVYTQSECLADPEIKACLGLDKPENIVKVTDSIIWVIEAKREHKQLDQAVDEAKEYAISLRASKNLKPLFITGVAGNDIDTYLLRTQFWNGKKKEWCTITLNGKAISSLMSPEIARAVLERGSEIEDMPTVNETLFLSKAERINEILHLGAINKNYRARVMAALLLALIDDAPPNIDASPSVLISEINARAKKILTLHNKPNFFSYIEIALPPTEDNHIKFKAALVQTIQELNNLNIRSAMNSGTDVLGKFYEVFLKYGNGAKEIGIVLTPRHITKFAVEVTDVTHRDVVFDPTCGTGGFLVAALDHVRANSTPSQSKEFMQQKIFGVEQEAEVVALAIVNMIFRGDGKNNIVEGNCFQKFLQKGKEGCAGFISKEPESEKLAVTKVLMNPPFALKRGEEKEYKFIDQALKQMQYKGTLFSVLPYSAMVKPKAYLNWRRNILLPQNTLLAVINFPPDLFYPVGVHTVGIFIQKGQPHPAGQNVLWVRAINDGLLKSKGKRLPNQKASDDYVKIKDTVKAFLNSQTLSVVNEEMFQKACPIDFDDPLLELVPENYLDQAPPTDTEIGTGIEQVIRDAAAFLIRTGREKDAAS